MHNVIVAAGADARPAEGLFFGWRVVGAAFVVFGWGMCFYGPPVLLYAIHAHRGWPLALISAAVTLHFLLGALVVANLPACYRRWGLPAVTRAGALAAALGMFGWAAADQPWQLFAATLLSGAGWAATGGAAINAMVSPWFARRRPAALSLAYNGASAGGILLSPLWVAAIAWLGLPGAAAALGTIMVVTLWLLAGRYFVHSPAELGLLVDGSGTESATAPRRDTSTRSSPTPVPARGSPWRDWRFRTLAAGMSLGLFAQIGLIAHLFSLIVPVLGTTGAGLAMATATAAAIAGRTLLGWLLPSGADRRLAAAGNYVLQFCGCLVFILAGGASAPLILLGILLFGMGIGNATSLPPLIAQMEFSPGEVLRVVALITACSQATYAFAPAVFGALRAALPATGGATALFFLAAGMLQLVAAGAYLLGRQKSRS
jgi:LPXTG-motif cell wall-anchored protein